MNPSIFRKIKFKLWLLGKFKIPMIGFVNPRLIFLDDTTVKIEIPLKRRTKNHLNSMYFGALMVGVDLAAGIHAVYFSSMMKEKISFAFKSVQSDFLKRPEENVVFEMCEGNVVNDCLLRSKSTGERVNEMVNINMYSGNELVGIAKMEISIKVYA